MSGRTLLSVLSPPVPPVHRATIRGRQIAPQYGVVVIVSGVSRVVVHVIDPRIKDLSILAPLHWSCPVSVDT